MSEVLLPYVQAWVLGVRSTTKSSTALPSLGAQALSALAGEAMLYMQLVVKQCMSLTDLQADRPDCPKTFGLRGLRGFRGLQASEPIRAPKVVSALRNCLSHKKRREFLRVLGGF